MTLKVISSEFSFIIRYFNSLIISYRAYERHRLFSSSSTNRFSISIINFSPSWWKFSIFVAIMQNDIQHVINIKEKILRPVEGKYHRGKVQKTSFTNVYVYCVILLLFTSFRESPICRSLPFFLYIYGVWNITHKYGIVELLDN